MTTILQNNFFYLCLTVVSGILSIGFISIAWIDKKDIIGWLIALFFSVIFIGSIFGIIMCNNALNDNYDTWRNDYSVTYYAEKDGNIDIVYACWTKNGENSCVKDYIDVYEKYAYDKEPPRIIVDKYLRKFKFQFASFEFDGLSDECNIDEFPYCIVDGKKIKVIDFTEISSIIEAKDTETRYKEYKKIYTRYGLDLYN